MTPEERKDIFLKRIVEMNYDDLFSAGCCLQFALRASLRGIGQLAFTPSMYDEGVSIGHVFVLMPSGDAFDHKGSRSIEELKRDFYPYAVPHYSISEASVRQLIADQELPDELVKHIFSIADKIIDEHLK